MTIGPLSFSRCTTDQQTAVIAGVMGSLLDNQESGGVWWIDVRARDRLDDLRLPPSGEFDPPSRYESTVPIDPGYEPTVPIDPASGYEPTAPIDPVSRYEPAAPVDTAPHHGATSGRGRMATSSRRRPRRAGDGAR